MLCAKSTYFDKINGTKEAITTPNEVPAIRPQSNEIGSSLRLYLINENIKDIYKETKHKKTTDKFNV